MLNKISSTQKISHPSERGNVFLALFGALAIVGAIGVTATGVMRGPMKNMSDVSARAITENQIMANTKLAVMTIADIETGNGKDCDKDGYVEPWAYVAAGANQQAPVGGGLLPADIPAIQATDAWGNAYGYCVWNHGTIIDGTDCGGPGQLRRQGYLLTDASNDALVAIAQEQTVIAIMSAGADRKFQTTCQDYVDTTPADGIVDTPLVDKPANSDDLVMSYTYAEAALATSSKWRVKNEDDWAVAGETEAEITEDKVEIGGNSEVGGKLDTAGLKLAEDPGDNSISGPCNSANDQGLRLNTGGASTVLEICDFVGTGNWEPVTGGGSGSNSCTIEAGQLSITDTFIDVVNLNTPNAVTVVGDYAYVVSLNSNNIRVFDISDPTTITALGFYTSASLTGASSVQVKGNIAFVGTRTHTTQFVSLDISNPFAITELDSISDAVNMESVYDFEIDGNYAYTVASGSDRLTVIDISDPNNLSVHSSITDPVLNGALDIQLIGNLAYVSILDGVAIVDISDPAVPVILGSTSLGLSISRAIAVKGNYAYVGDQANDTLYSIDISDPTTPTLVDTLVDPVQLDYILDLRERGNYLFVGTSGTSDAVSVVDISNPADLQVVEFLQDATNLNGASGLFFKGNYLYVTARGSDALNIIDIGCDLAPEATIETGSSVGFDPEAANCQQNNGGPLVELDNFNTPNIANSLWGDGTYIYLADYSSGLRAYTFDGSLLVEVGLFDTPGNADSVWGDGTYIYVADNVSGLRAYTFNGTTFTEEGAFNTPDNANGIWGDGTYIYVADGLSGIRAYSFDGATFTEEGAFNTPIFSSDVWGDGAYIYVTDGSNGINAYSFDGASFSLVDVINTPGNADAIWGDGTYIYVADFSGGIRAYTFDGSNFTEVGSFITPDSAHGVWGDGTYIYVADWSNGIETYSFDGLNFTNINSFDTPGNATDIWGDGTYIYVADRGNGIRVYSGYECIGAGAYGIGNAVEQDYVANQAFSQPISSDGSLESYGTSIMLKSDDYAAEAGIAFDVDTTLGDDEVPAASITGMRSGLNGEGTLAFKTQDSLGDLETRVVVDPQGDIGINSFTPYNVTGKVQINNLPSSAIDYYDIQNPNCIANNGGSLVEVGRTATIGTGTYSVSDGNYIYTADGTNGLNVYSFNGTDFTLLDNFVTADDAGHIWIDDNYIYVADSTNSIMAFTFDGSALTQVSTEAIPGVASHIWGDDEYIYVAAQDAGIHAYIFNGTVFTLVDTYDTTGSARSIWGDADYLYLADHGGGINAFTFDGTSFSLVESQPTINLANNVWGDGNYIYVADLTGGVQVYSFDGATFTLIDTDDTSGNAYDITGDGYYLYGADGLSGINIYTFDGENLVVQETLDTTGEAWSIFSDGSYLYVSDNTDLIAYSGYECLSVDGWQGPTRGLLVGAADVPDLNFDPEGANCTNNTNNGPFVEVGDFNTSAQAGEIWGDGEYIYLADGASGVHAYTFDGTTFTQLDVFDTSGSGHSVWGDGEYIYVADGAPGINAYTFDGTTFTELDVFNTTGGVIDMWGDGTYIYAASAAGGLYAFTFDGTAFTEIDVFNTPGDAINAWGDGEYIYVADSVTGGLRAYSFDGTTFTELGFLITPDRATNVWGDGEHIYVADRNTGIIAYSFDGTTFTQLDVFNTSGDADRVWGDGTHVYLADDGGGIYAFTFDGTTFTEVDNFNTPGGAIGIWGDGEYIYVADRASGIRAYSGFGCLTESMSFFGLDGEGDVSANVLHSNGLKIQDTNLAGNTITEIMSLDTSGNATFTQEDLEMSSADDVALKLFKASEISSDTSNLFLKRNRGTMDALAPVQDGDIVGVIGFSGYDGAVAAPNGNAAIYSKVNGMVTGTNVPLDLYFSTDPAGNANASSDMVFTQDGLMGVGTESPIEMLHSAERITFYEGLRIGNDVNCSAVDDYGVIRYTGSAFEYCDITNTWINLVDGNAAMTPAALEFNPNLGNCTVNDGTAFTLIDSDNPAGGTSRGVWGDGTYIYMADGTNGIHAYTFNGTAFTLVSTFDTVGNAYAIWGDGTYLYVADDSRFTAFTFDGTTFTREAVTGTVSNAHSVWGDGTYVYVTDDSDGFRAYSFDGTTLSLLSTYNPTRDVVDIWTDGNYVYTTEENDGLVAYSFDGTTFTPITPAVTESAYAVTGDESGYIYTMQSQRYVNAYEFVTHIDEYNGGGFSTSGFDRDIWADGVNIYAATGEFGVKAYSFDGFTLDIIDEIGWTGETNGIWGDGTYIYATNDNAGIRAYSGFECLSTAPQKEDIIDWTDIEKTEVIISASDAAATDEFGTQVGLSGNYLMVTAPKEDRGFNNSGSIYKYDATTGVEIGQTTASDAVNFLQMGLSLSVSGNYSVVGAPADAANGVNAGSAYVFNLETGAQIEKLLPPDVVADDRFGTKVAVSGNYIVVTAARDDNALGVDAGAVYVYDIGAGEILYKLFQPDGSANARFGNGEIAIWGKYAIIGAPADGNGTAHIFDISTGDFVRKVVASDASASDNFGFGIDMSENYIVVGAPFDDDNGSDSGSVYVFDRETGNELRKITPPDGVANDKFGYNSYIKGNHLFVNAEGHNSGVGAVYIFNLTTGELIKKLEASDAASGDKFGDTMAISGNLLAVGSQFADDAVLDSGAVYLYRGRWTDRITSDTDCYPHSLNIEDITNAASNTDVTTTSITLKSFARGCRLTLASESSDIDIIQNSVAVGASFADVKAGDEIELEIRSSSTAGASVKNIVTLGDQREEFTVRTAP